MTHVVPLKYYSKNFSSHKDITRTYSQDDVRLMNKVSNTKITIQPTLDSESNMISL